MGQEHQGTGWPQIKKKKKGEETIMKKETNEHKKHFEIQRRWE